MTRNLVAHLGPKQQKALYYLYSWGPAPSVNHLARLVGPHKSAYYGRMTIKRLRDRGLIEVDPTHPDTGSRSRGAVILTADGEEACRKLFAKGGA